MDEEFLALLKESIGKIELSPPKPEVASRAINAAKIRTDDPLKDWTPPQTDECPICFLPLPVDRETTYRECCGKHICSGCVYGCLKANHPGRKMSERESENMLKIISICPFCRTSETSLTDTDCASRVKKRAELGIAEDMYRLGSWYNYGEMGFKQDHDEANIWWNRAADAGGWKAMSAIGLSYRDGVDGLEKDIVKGMRYLQKSAESGEVMTFWCIAYENWKSGEIEDAILNFRKGAICGDDRGVEQMLPLFKSGFITKEEYLFTLRAYQTASNEMKSKAREDCKVFFGREGHTMLEGAELLIS